jgi:serine/threonine protein kinase
LKIKTIGEGPFSKIKLYLDVEKNKKVAIKKYNLFILKKKMKMERG